MNDLLTSYRSTFSLVEVVNNPIVIRSNSCKNLIGSTSAEVRILAVLDNSLSKIFVDDVASSMLDQRIVLFLEIFLLQCRKTLILEYRMFSCTFVYKNINFVINDLWSWIYLVLRDTLDSTVNFRILNDNIKRRSGRLILHKQCWG